MDPRAHIAVVFVSRRTREHDDDYAVMAERMEALARQQPGFVDIVSVRDPVTRVGITVAYFTDEEAVLAWKGHPEHREAQRRGEVDFYEQYEVTVAAIQRWYESPTADGSFGQFGRDARGLPPAHGGPVTPAEA